MKKHLKLFVIALMGLFLFTGCGEKELKPVDVLQKVLENTEEITSLTMNASIDLKLEQEGTIVEMPITLGVAMQMENDTTGKFKLSLGENPLIGTMDLYLDKKDTTSTVYMPSSIIAMLMGVEEDKTYWIKEETSETEEDTGLSLDFNLEEFEQLKDAKLDAVLTDKDLVFVDEEGAVKHYTLNITQDLINRISKALEIEVEEDTGAIDSLKIELYIDTDNNRLTKVSIDLLKTVKEIVGDTMDEESGMDLEGLQKLTLSLSLTGYNTTTVTIPENVIDEAITSEEYARMFIGEE